MYVIAVDELRSYNQQQGIRSVSQGLIMQRVALDDAPASVRDFLLSLHPDRDGIGFELDGKVVCEFFPPLPADGTERLLERGRQLAARSRRRNQYVDSQQIDAEIEQAIETVRSRQSS